MTITIRLDRDPPQFNANGDCSMKIERADVVAIIANLSEADAADRVTEDDQFGPWATGIKPATIQRILPALSPALQAKIQPFVAFCAEHEILITVLSNDDCKLTTPPSIEFDAFDRNEIDWNTGHALDVFEALGLPLSTTEGTVFRAQTLANALATANSKLNANDRSALQTLVAYALSQGGELADIAAF
jgi:hypothetical protein